MGAGGTKKAIKKDAEAQERNAATQERLADYSFENSKADRERQNKLFELLSPYAQELMGVFDKEKIFGDEASKFPEFNRPDFGANINRDYYDDLANIEQVKNQSIAGADDYYTSSGLGRTGIRTGATGSIVRGANADRSAALRNKQGRDEYEDRDRYEDERDITLRAHADKRSLNSERINAGLQGSNVLAGQQATFNPTPWFQGAQRGYGGATAGYGAAAGNRYNAAQIPGGWQKAAGFAGGIAGAAAGGPNGLKGIWGGR